jgi:hypothetical protein
MTERQETATDRRTAPLCDHGTIYGMNGSTVTEMTECANDAVGKYRIEGRHGGTSENWLCEEHRDQYDEDALERIELINIDEDDAERIRELLDGAVKPEVIQRVE